MREVIQVERAGGQENVAELSRVADELLAPLVARMGVSELGEIEVRQGAWRVRIRRAVAPAVTPASGHGPPPGAAVAAPASGAVSGAPGAGRDAVGGSHPTATGAAQDHPVATSTAVGYFGVKAAVAVGHRVALGDVIGWVDVLGVRKEIVSPADGVVGRFLTEPGDPVEYGQELIAIVPSVPGAGGLASGAPDATGLAADAPDAPADTRDPGAHAGPAGTDGAAPTAPAGPA